MKNYFLCLLILFAFFLNSYTQEKVIVIDPGHNFDDIANLYRTETEVNTNWAVATNLLTQIEDYASYYDLDWEVKLTRSDNNAGSNVEISQRERIANSWEDQYPGKVYFLSIHCNGVLSASAVANGQTFTATGTETFYCNQGFSTNDELLIRYAQSIQDNMAEHGEWTSRRNGLAVEDDSYYGDCLDPINDPGSPCSKCGGHLCVLNDLTMPNCLNEIGFADNSVDAEKLNNENWRYVFANAYFEGLMEAFSDINAISYNVEIRPNFTVQPYERWCKVNVVLKDVTTNYWSGDIRARFLDFPEYIYEYPSNEHCQLGDEDGLYLAPNSTGTVTFEGEVPTSFESGKTLILESKAIGSDVWKRVPTINHRKMIKVPINGILVDGYIEGNQGNSGISVYSYEYFNLKSLSLTAPILDPVFDPTVDRTDSDGNFEVIMPYSWETGAVLPSSSVGFEEAIVNISEGDQTVMISQSSSGDNNNTGDNNGISEENIPSTTKLTEHGCRCLNPIIPRLEDGYDGYVSIAHTPLIDNNTVYYFKDDVGRWKWSFNMVNGVFYNGFQPVHVDECENTVYKYFNSHFNGSIVFRGDNREYFNPNIVYKISYRLFNYDDSDLKHKISLVNYQTFNHTPQVNYSAKIEGIGNTVMKYSNSTASSCVIDSEFEIATLCNDNYECDGRSFEYSSYYSFTKYIIDYRMINLVFQPDDYYTYLKFSTNGNDMKFAYLNFTELCDTRTQIISDTNSNIPSNANSIIVKDLSSSGLPLTSDETVYASESIIFESDVIITPNGGEISFIIDPNKACSISAY